MPDDRTGQDGLEVPFLFVPHGDPEPTEWMAQHPGWVKFPARFVPHGVEKADDAIVRVQAVAIGPAAAGVAAEAAPGAVAIGDAALAVVKALPAALGALPLAGVAAVGGLLWSSGLNAGEVSPSRYPRRPARGDIPPEGFSALPPQPPLPGSVPAPMPGEVPGEGGFTAHPQGHPVPGSVPPVMPPLFLPGELPTEQGPLILEQQRNEGLPAEQKSYSWRVRKTLEQVGDAATKLLPGRDWVGHHLINVDSVRTKPGLFAAAARAGWRTDEAENLVALPADEAAQRRLREHGIELPVQRGGHPNWNRVVREKLERRQKELDNSGYGEGTVDYNQEAWRLLERVEKELREELRNYPKLTELMAERSEDLG